MSEADGPKGPKKAGRDPTRILKEGVVQGAEALALAPSLSGFLRVGHWIYASPFLDDRWMGKHQKEKFLSDMQLCCLGDDRPAKLLDDELQAVLPFTGGNGYDAGIVRKCISRTPLSRNLDNMTAAQKVAQSMLNADVHSLTFSLLPGYCAWQSLIEHASSKIESIGLQFRVDDDPVEGASQKRLMAERSIDVGIVALGTYLAREGDLFLPHKYNLSRPAARMNLKVLRMGDIGLNFENPAQIHGLAGSSAAIVAQQFKKNHPKLKYVPLHIEALRKGERPTIAYGDCIAMAQTQAKYAERVWVANEIDEKKQLLAIVWRKKYCRRGAKWDAFRFNVEQLLMNAWLDLRDDDGAFDRLKRNERRRQRFIAAASCI